MDAKDFNLPKKCLEITNETVNVALSGCFMDDVFVVVVAKTSAEFFIVHFWFIFTDTPSSCDLEINKINFFGLISNSKLDKYLIRIS
jgi:hypothetical protein